MGSKERGEQTVFQEVEENNSYLDMPDLSCQCDIRTELSPHCLLCTSEAQERGLDRFILGSHVHEAVNQSCLGH